MYYQSKVVSVIFIFMLVYVGQAAGDDDFKRCFEPCNLGCVLPKDKFKCGWNCLVKCVESSFSSSSRNLYLDLVVQLVNVLNLALVGLTFTNILVQHFI